MVQVSPQSGHSERVYETMNRDSFNARIVNQPFNHSDNYAVLLSGALIEVQSSPNFDQFYSNS